MTDITKIYKNASYVSNTFLLLFLLYALIVSSYDNVCILCTC